MRKKVYIKVIIFILVFLILLYSNDIIDTIKFSFYICINNLFPSIIPFMLLSNILINYNVITNISFILEKIISKLFNINKYCSSTFIMSFISGTPTNAIYLNNLLKNNLISIEECKKCINIFHFINPIFIINTIGVNFLNSKKSGILIFISHFISTIILGIINRNNDKTNYKSIVKNNTNNFMNVLKNSIINTVNTLLMILGIITTCLIITCILNKILNINDNNKYIYGLLEITQGLKFLSISNINFYLKMVIASFIISFGGICIHLQIFSIIDNKKIRYLPYLRNRIIHGLISSIITIIFIILLY